MKKIFTLAVALAAIATIGCSTIDVALTQKGGITKKMKKIVVFPFEIKGANWGDEFSDSISHHFFKSGKVDVVEREAINKILKEQKLGMTGLVDDSKIAQIGKLLGADVIILGRGTALSRDELGKGHANLIDTFSLKGISVETGAQLFTVRKEPGKAWNWAYRAKYCCSLTLIWNSNDILIQSLRYDDISKQIVANILDAINEIEKESLKKG